MSLLGCSVALALAPRSAAGQTASSIAEGLFNDGQTLYEAERYDEACPKFQESDRIEPAVGTKLNLAACEEARGRTATAWALYRVVVEQLPIDDRRRAFAIERREAVAPLVSHLTIRLAETAPLETTVEFGDSVLTSASLDTALPIDPGHFVVRARAPGRAETTFEVDAKPGASVELVVAPGAALPAVPQPPAASGPAPAATPPEDTGPQRTVTPMRIVALSVGGAGVVAWIASGIFTARAVSKNRESNENGCEGNVCDAVGKELRLDARAAGNAATATLVVGSALVGTGVALWFLGAPKERSVQVGLAPAAGGAHFAIRGVLR